METSDFGIDFRIAINVFAGVISGKRWVTMSEFV